MAVARLQNVRKPGIAGRRSRQIAEPTEDRPNLHPMLRFQQQVGNSEVARMMPKQDQGLAPLMPEVGLNGGPISNSLMARIQAKRGRGAPLDQAKRAHFEERLDAPLHDVQIHSDEEAAVLNESISAQAFTIGDDIFLRRAADANDMQLLAHELTHVRQQSSMDSSGGPMVVGPADDHMEQQAHKEAGAVAQKPGRNKEHVPTDPAGVSLTPDPCADIPTQFLRQGKTNTQLQRQLGNWLVGSMIQRLTEEEQIVAQVAAQATEGETSTKPLTEDHPAIPDKPKPAAQQKPVEATSASVVEDHPAIPDKPKPAAQQKPVEATSASVIEDHPAIPDKPKPAAQQKPVEATSASVVEDHPAFPDKPKPTAQQKPVEATSASVVEDHPAFPDKPKPTAQQKPVETTSASVIEDHPAIPPEVKSAVEKPPATEQSSQVEQESQDYSETSSRAVEQVLDEEL